MKDKLLRLAQKMGFIQKMNANKMTSSDWDSLSAAFKTEHGVDLEAALEENKKTASVTQEHQAAIAALFADLDADGNPIKAVKEDTKDPKKKKDESIMPPKKTSGDEEEDEDEDEAGKKKETASKQQSDVNLSEEVGKMRKQLHEMSITPEASKDVADVGKGSKAIALMASGPGTNKTHLFGIPNNLFAIDKRWNQMAAQRKVKDTNYSPSDRDALITEFNGYGTELASRFNELFINGQLMPMLAGNLDYTGLENDLGDYYQVRRQDAIIDYIIRLDSISRIVPIRYNVQDEEVIVNVFEGKSYSQSYQSGRVFAGGFTFEPDKAKVVDVMFKFKFSDLKDLERQYIGYLNTNGSDPIKWSFIEWIMVKCATLQHNEVEARRIAGVRVNSTVGKSAYFMYGSDGLLTTLERLKNTNRVYVFDDLLVYSPSTLLEYVRTFVRKVWRLKGSVAFRQFKLYMNELDVPDFYEQYREKYGKDSNFNGESLEIKDFPLPNIVPVPNMGDRKDMWMCPDGTMEIHELVPGEFMNYNFQRDFEELFVMSYKKEGTFLFAGRKYETKAALLASKGKHTNIFANNPAAALDADATTADALTAESFISSENTAATVLTNIANAVEGVAYKIACGATGNATSVAKAGSFSLISAAWTPTVVDDYLVVIFDPVDAKFHDIERKVNGVRTVNSAAKAPEYVEQ